MAAKISKQGVCNNAGQERFTLVNTGLEPVERFFRLAKARAASRGEDYVTPDDLKAVAHPVLVHRMMLRPEAHMRGATIDRVLDDILERVRVPGAAR